MSANPPSAATPTCIPSITLEIKGLGHVIALKNSMYAIVDKEKREWKRRCVQSFLSQLLSVTPMNEPGIQTQHFQQYLIASLPRDDSWKDIPEIHIRCLKCPPGHEGATIEITAI